VQAAAKDPAFALAQVGLANSSGTAKEFFDAVARAVSLAGKASEPEKLLVCALDAGAKGEPVRQRDCLARLVAACPDDERAHNLMGAFHFGRQEYEAAVAEYEKALALDPKFVASYVGIGNDRVFMGQGDDARKAYAKLRAIARNDGERRQAHFWTAMSYVHEGATDKALSELQKMATIDQAGKDLVALSGVTAQMGNVLLEAGRVEEAAAKYRERSAIIDRAEVATQVKEAAHRQALFDEARVALARNVPSSAKAKAAAYQAAATAKGIPFELRQGHELSGRIALAEKDYAKAAAELGQANQQDPGVLYLAAVALQKRGDAKAAKELAVRAAEWNGLSNSYGYVRTRARALVSGTP